MHARVSIGARGKGLRNRSASFYMAGFIMQQQQGPIASRMQDFTTVYKMLPEGVTTMDELVRFLTALTLRYPSEPTMAVITSICLIMQHGFQAAMSMSPENKYEALQQVKRQVQSQKTYQPAPKNFISKLPATAGDLMKAYPMVYAEAYQDKAPQHIGASELEFCRMTASIKLRKTAKWTSAQADSALGEASRSADSRLWQILLQAAGNPQAMIRVSPDLHHKLLYRLVLSHARGVVSHAPS